MVQFNQKLIEKIREAVDLVDVIGQDIELRQRGGSFVGLCPFHDEKTPSFNVNPKEQLYYCFGCGQGGDVFNYIMKAKNVSFPEAVRAMGELSNIEVPHASPRQREIAEKTKQITTINRLAAKYYYRLLRIAKNKFARNYLMERQIDSDVANHFYLGYASDQWNGLVEFFETRDIPLTQVEEAGLIARGKNGYYDRYRNRIMFPICDANKNFIGFGARTIGQDQPKYLNSPESLVFRKSSCLYGLNWAKNTVKELDYVILVEGYTDCIGLYRHGMTNVVASLGTALTKEHAQLVSRFTTNVIMAFDSDTAGINATQRGLEIFKQVGLNVKIAPLPLGLDPDSFARTNSTEVVRKWISDAVPYMEYLIKNIVNQFNINSPAGKVQASKEIINILLKLESPIERLEYSNYVSNLLSVDKSVLQQELKQLAQDKDYGVNLGKTGKFPHITSKSRYTIKDLRADRTSVHQKRGSSIESSIMRLLLSNPGYIEKMEAVGLDEQDFIQEDYRHLFSLLTTGEWDKHGELVAEKLFELPKPRGRWEDYLKQFQNFAWHQSLNKIEENLSLVENHSESDVLLQLCGLLRQYYGVRREILLARQ